MSDRKGDPLKQPESCKKLVSKTRCPNMRETSSNTDMSGETYSCPVCGEYFRLYYEDMA